MSTFWITVLVWVLPAYLFHAILHEMSHYFIAWSDNLKVTEVCLYPTYRDGRLLFAYVVVPELPKASFRTRLAFSWAPLWTEFFWLSLTLALAITIRPSGVLLGFLAVEAVAALVDAGVWLLGWWTDRAQTDAWRVRMLKGWSSTRVRLLSLLWLAPAALTAWVIWTLA